MAKITEDQRVRYQERIRFYKNKIEEAEKEQKALKLEVLKNPNRSYLEIKIAELSLLQISIYCAMNEISLDLLDVRNTSLLERARQLLSDVLINLGNVVTNYLDVPFSEYEEKLQSLSEMTDIEKYNFIRKIGYCVDIVEYNFGENSKWKWSFVDIDGKLAIIVKNLFDLRRFQKLDSPYEAGYKERRAHLSIVQKLLSQVSHKYREKYELSGKDIEDLKKAIDFQKALLRIVNLLGDTEKIENVKKQIEVWNTLMEKHFIELEEKKKKK